MAKQAEAPVTFNCAPTVAKFMQSKAFVRGMRGPFGSGKSTACCMEIMRLASEMPQTKKGTRRSRVAVIRNCYDDQTEILTESRGWVLFKDLIEGEKVGIQKDGKLCFEEPTYYYQKHYKGEMLGIKSENLDCLVTPDHKMWVKRINGRTKVRSESLFIKAHEIYGKTNYEFDISAPWDEDGAELTDVAYAEFLGLWFAEGSAGIYAYGSGTKYRVVITQKKYCDYVEGVLQRANLTYYKTHKHNGCYDFVLRVTPEVKVLAKTLSAYGHALDKRIPDYVKRASIECINAFIYGYQMGDGSFKNGRTKRSDQLFTASEILADDLQEMLARAGRASTIYKDSSASENGLYAVTILQPLRQSPSPDRKNWYKQNYDGVVYCVEVSTHVVLVRRNKKQMYCSQTYRELQDTTIKTWLEWFPESLGQFHHNDMAHYVRGRLPDGTVLELDVLFRALDRPDDIKKLKSLELTGIWINEASEIPLEIIEVALTRVGRFPRRDDVKDYRSYMIMDTNPPDSDSWWYKLAEEFVPKLKEYQKKGFKRYQDALSDLYKLSGASIDAEHLSDEEARDNFVRLTNKYEFFAQPSGLSAQAENTENLRPGYYYSEALGKSPEWVNVYIHGNYGFMADGKPVYPEYKDNLHYNPSVIDPDGDNKVIIRGWDGGRTPACIYMQLTPRGHLLVFDELIGNDIGLSEFGDRVKKHSANFYSGYKFYDVGDPAIFQKSQLEDRAPNIILSAKGINLQSAGTNSPRIRKEALKKLLREFSDGIPCFQIGPKAKMTRKGLMGGYQYKRKQVSGTEYQEKPSKNEYSHPVEALEYPCIHIFRNMLVDEEYDVDEMREDTFEFSRRHEHSHHSSAGRSAVTGY